MSGSKSCACTAVSTSEPSTTISRVSIESSRTYRRPMARMCESVTPHHAGRGAPPAEGCAPSAAHGSGLFAGALLARLLVVAAQLHFAIHTFTLQLLLERAEGLVDIVIANHDLHKLQYLDFAGQSPRKSGVCLLE